MAKYCILLALLFVGVFALPARYNDGPSFDKDMSIFFDRSKINTEGRIVGGTIAAEGAYPWMVAISSGLIRFFVCGGSVITDRHVLTAAHCITAIGHAGLLSQTARVRIGTNIWNNGGQVYQLQGYVNHEHFNPNIVEHDIGILISSTIIEMNNRVRIIPLNPAFIPGNAAARASGWGRISTSGPQSEPLLELSTTVVDGQRCVAEVAAIGQQLNMRPPPVDPVLEICTFTAHNQGACTGDSGSALILNSNDQQIGIVSWGLPCARGAPDIYVRVSAYMNWIANAIDS